MMIVIVIVIVITAMFGAALVSIGVVNVFDIVSVFAKPMAPLHKDGNVVPRVVDHAASLRLRVERRNICIHVRIEVRFEGAKRRFLRKQ